MGRGIRLVVVALAAAPDPSTPQVVDDGTLAAGEKLPAPKGEVVLTVTGDIGSANKGKKLELDLASLEKMRRVRMEAAEPFLKRRVTFEGVLLLQLDAVAEGIEEAEQAASLVTLGCRDGQDFHFARPLTAAAMTELLGETLADGGFYLPSAAAPVETPSG